MNETIDTATARTIIECLGQSGTPPEYGFQYFTVGLSEYLECLENDYLSSYIKDGGSSFKMIEGVYGGGKTHFLYCLRELAWKYNFVVSYIVLSPESTPFFKLELVYSSIVSSLMPPLCREEVSSGTEKGLRNLLKRWFYQQYSQRLAEDEDFITRLRQELQCLESVESISFSHAVKNALLSLAEDQTNNFDIICQWLHGEGYIKQIHSQFNILEKIDRTTAFKMIRSLVQTIKGLGYSGMVLLLDEGEQKSSMSSNQRSILLSNLREVVDACGHSNFKNVLVTYAVPDESFLEGRTQVYEALRQRLATTFEEINPTGVKINLEKIVKEPIPFLEQLGMELAKIFEVAYNSSFEESVLQETVNMIANEAHLLRYADIGYKRMFVKMMVKGLFYLKNKGQKPNKEHILVGA